MAWRDRQLPGSFRGIAFESLGDTLDGGRRGPVHEYPLRDPPYREDMGRKARTVSVSALVVGDDYLDQLDQLVGALEDGRPGELIHPWYGRITVYVDTYTVTHSSAEMGQATVEMNFHERGDLQFPTYDDASGAVDLTADIVDTTAEADAVSLSDVTGRASWVGDRALARMTSLSSTVQTYTTGPVRAALADAAGFRDALDDIASGGLSMASDAAAQADAVRAMVVSIGDIGPLGRVIDALPLPVNTGVESTADGLAAEAAEEASARLWRRTFVAEAAREAAALTWESYDDAVAARERVTGWIESEMLAVPISREAFEALTDLRSKVAADLTDRAAALPRLRTVEQPVELPALVVAWRLYRDADRAGEIVARNDVAHAGFVAGSLRVLSS